MPAPEGIRKGRIEDMRMNPYQFADANGAGLALLGQLVFIVENEQSLVARKQCLHCIDSLHQDAL